jgi:hypothetical protein
MLTGAAAAVAIGMAEAAAGMAEAGMAAAGTMAIAAQAWPAFLDWVRQRCWAA